MAVVVLTVSADFVAAGEGVGVGVVAVFAGGASVQVLVGFFGGIAVLVGEVAGVGGTGVGVGVGIVAVGVAEDAVAILVDGGPTVAFGGVIW